VERLIMEKGIEIDDIDWGDENKWGFYSDKIPESARDSGYKNAAYALGELVDNSIQADAKNVDIIIFEKMISIGSGRRAWRAQEVGIIDNGIGMDPFLQRCSIKYQDGANQQGLNIGDEDKQMGKFGVGLPQASISQARKVGVYTWLNGLESSTYTYIDFDEPETFRTVPKPIKKIIPKKWRGTSQSFGKTGTIIIWSKLDRFSWKTSKAIHRNSEFVIGRMYRKHISENGVIIRLAAYESEGSYKLRWTDADRDGIRTANEEHDWVIRANDPLYLDSDAFDGDGPESPGFALAGKPQESFHKWTDTDGKNHNERVVLTFSMAKKETRAGHGYDSKINSQALGGDQSHGRHAKKNVGLSIVRERRELELDRGYAFGGKNPAYDRWWGAELSFGRGMDELFGVTNNKQHAQRLNDVALKDWKEFQFEEEEEEEDVMKRLKDNDFSTYVCLKVKKDIVKNIGIIRNLIEKTSIKKKRDRKSRHEGAEAQGSKAIDKRRKEGKRGESDEFPDMSKEDKKHRLREKLVKDGVDEDLIDYLEGKIVVSGYDVVFSERKMDTDAFFSVEQTVGSLIVYLNQSHDAYKHLFAALEDIEINDKLSEEELIQRGIHASNSVKLLLGAWARYEDEAGAEEKKRLLKFRRGWGAMADDFMDDFGKGY